MKEIENTIAEYFDELYEMGMPMQLKPFGKGYRLEIGNIHIYFENEQLAYTGWGIDLGASQEGAKGVDLGLYPSQTKGGKGE